MTAKRTPLERARAATSNARAAADLLHEATEDLTPRLAKLYTGVVHDVMRGMGLRDFTLPHTLHPVTVARTIAGPVFTLRGKVTPKADPHETLLAWTGFLSKAKSGHIVVIEANERRSRTPCAASPARIESISQPTVSSRNAASRSA